MTLGDSILFMEFLDYPTIISIVGVLLVEDTVAATSTFITPRAVPAMLFMIRLCREGPGPKSGDIFARIGCKTGVGGSKFPVAPRHSRI
jgi:hypothetical protein